MTEIAASVVLPAVLARAEAAEARLSAVRARHARRTDPLHRWVACSAHVYADAADAISCWDQWATCKDCGWMPEDFCAACRPGTIWPCETYRLTLDGSTP